jgi:drug/metabolite transporter (DMT)-like permease
MAEIRVEPRRRSRIWIWLLLAAIVAGLVYYFFYYQPG